MKRRPLTPTLLLCAATFLPQTGGAAMEGKWNPPLVERMRLPQYCQAQFDPAIKKLGARTPMDLCGVFMNHFCPALVQLNRAADPKYPRDERRRTLRDAMNELDYTKNKIRSDCLLMGDFQGAMTRARTLAILLK